jgi:hypothetical protein
MKIWFHPYQLIPQERKLKPRKGVLLKVEWTAGHYGYSDLHPWTEFGEPQLDDHLAGLARLQFSNLVENSLEFNYRDFELRRLKRSAFTGLILPRAHRLVFDVESLTQNQLMEWADEGFTHIKVKLGRNLGPETERLIEFACSTPILWRVDFNGRVPEANFLDWWSGLDPAVKARIDFVEDPVADRQLAIDGPWANDWKTQMRARIRIIKPARETDDDLGGFDRVVFTHSLDHAFGQACSLWRAALFYGRHPRRMEVCGLGATNFFEPTEFCRKWSSPGPRLAAPEGYGFGFGELLGDMPWERLV